MERLSKISMPVIDIKKYGGKQVAITDGKIIAVGRSLKEVINKARKIQPSKSLSEIRIFSVPKTLAAIYYVTK